MERWAEDSLEDFADGHLDASGQNIHVNRDGDHHTTSRVFYNDGRRFSRPRTVHLPAGTALSFAVHAGATDARVDTQP